MAASQPLWCKASVLFKEMRKVWFSFLVCEEPQAPCYWVASCLPAFVNMLKISSAVFNKRGCVWGKTSADVVGFLFPSPWVIAGREQWHYYVIRQPVSHLDFLHFSYVVRQSLNLFRNTYMLFFGYEKAFHSLSFCLTIFSHLWLLLIKFHLNIYYLK